LQRYELFFIKIFFMITFFSEETNFKLKSKRNFSKWLKIVASSHDREIGELNYIFCSDEYLLEINRQSLGHDYYTDIITFDNSDDYDGTGSSFEGKINGDIYISIDTVRNNGEQYGEGFDQELKRVIAHGLLHIIGFDDITPDLEAEMHRQEEIAITMFE